MRIFIAGGLILGYLASIPGGQPYVAQGQEPNPSNLTAAIEDEPIQSELTQLRDRIVNAFESSDVDAITQDLGENVLITWQNAERVRGTDELRAYYHEMLKGDHSRVADVKIKVEVDGPAVLYGDSTAVARGTIEDRFVMRDGKEFTLDSKWTATIVKLDGEWKVVSFHVSANVFDNPILVFAKSWIATVGIAGALLGFLLGGTLVWFINRSTQNAVDRL